MNRRILLIVNPHAASGRAVERCDRWLLRFGRPEARSDYVLTERPSHATLLAQEAAPKYDLVVAVGGDGTVNEVATGLLLAGESRAALVFCPSAPAMTLPG